MINDIHFYLFIVAVRYCCCCCGPGHSLSLSFRWYASLLRFQFELKWMCFVIVRWICSSRAQCRDKRFSSSHPCSLSLSHRVTALFCSNRFLFVPYTSFLFQCSHSLSLSAFLFFSQTTAKTTTTSTATATMTVMNSNSIFCWMSKYLFILFRYFIVSFFKSVRIRFQQFQVNLN